jgi:hypothetical protein
MTYSVFISAARLLHTVRMISKDCSANQKSNKLKNHFGTAKY